ncbi:hypothetical protein N0V86_006588 [Didymella sp. IMI 355093]|nr:hypothetical protein N0V86_006588 [Didymella sp. IMI 355093]
MSRNDQPVYFASSTELADLGAARFDHDTAAVGDKDYALTSYTQAPVTVQAGRAPKGLESQVFAWNTFQYTTSERDKKEEKKGDLHEGQLHRANRAAAGIAPPSMMAHENRPASYGSGCRGGRDGRGGQGGRGGGGAGRDDGQLDALCAGRKPEALFNLKNHFMTIKPNENEREVHGRLLGPVAESNDDRRRRWACLLRSRHYEPVIFDILSDELPKYANSRAIDPTDIVTHMRECALILASAPHIFFAAVEGNLISRMLSDADLQADVNPSQHAHRIDNITSPIVTSQASTQGHRKYLSTPSTDQSPKRIATINRFIAGIASRCAQVPLHLHSTPLSFPPSEVGYALNAHKRLAQHRAHQSSNYVMNVVEDICTYLYCSKALSQHFKMHQFIAYLIFQPSQAAIAEIFCSGLLQCWVEEGGFNAHPAGRSVASSQRVATEAWEAFSSMAKSLGPLKGNMQVLRDRAEIWRNALDWKDEDEDETTTEKEPKMMDDNMDVV